MILRNSLADRIMDMSSDELASSTSTAHSSEERPKNLAGPTKTARPIRQQQSRLCYQFVMFALLSLIAFSQVTSAHRYRDDGVEVVEAMSVPDDTDGPAERRVDLGDLFAHDQLAMESREINQVESRDGISHDRGESNLVDEISAPTSDDQSGAATLYGAPSESVPSSEIGVQSAAAVASDDSYGSPTQNNEIFANAAADEEEDSYGPPRAPILASPSSASADEYGIPTAPVIGVQSNAIPVPFPIEIQPSSVILPQQPRPQNLPPQGQRPQYGRPPISPVGNRQPPRQQQPPRAAGGQYRSPKGPNAFNRPLSYPKPPTPPRQTLPFAAEMANLFGNLNPLRQNRRPPPGHDYNRPKLPANHYQRPPQQGPPQRQPQPQRRPPSSSRPIQQQNTDLYKSPQAPPLPSVAQSTSFQAQNNYGAARPQVPVPVQSVQSPVNYGGPQAASSFQSAIQFGSPQAPPSVQSANTNFGAQQQAADTYGVPQAPTSVQSAESYGIPQAATSSVQASESYGIPQAANSVQSAESYGIPPAAPSPQEANNFGSSPSVSASAQSIDNFASVQSADSYGSPQAAASVQNPGSFGFGQAGQTAQSAQRPQPASTPVSSDAYSVQSADLADNQPTSPVPFKQSADESAFKPMMSFGDEDDLWPMQDENLPKITALDVRCEKDMMEVTVTFDGDFNGIIFSKNHYMDSECMHVVANTGGRNFTFDIANNRCGTKGNSRNGNYGYGTDSGSGSYYETTVIFQYHPLIQEMMDQARQLRCTWYEQYEKNITFNPFQVKELDVVTADFAGDNVGCWMQIQAGAGPRAPEASNIVEIGEEMTMVMAIKDDDNKFDMMIRNCMAHDGNGHKVNLVDNQGCRLRPKLMGKFQKTKEFGKVASVMMFARFYAFKFPDQINVYFECTIQICRNQCPEQCSSATLADDSLSLPVTPNSSGSVYTGGRGRSLQNGGSRRKRRAAEDLDSDDIGVQRLIQVVTADDLSLALKKQKDDTEIDIFDAETNETSPDGHVVSRRLNGPRSDRVVERIMLDGQVCMSTPVFAMTLVLLLVTLAISCFVSTIFCLRYKSNNDSDSSLIAVFANPMFAHKKQVGAGHY